MVAPRGPYDPPASGPLAGLMSDQVENLLLRAVLDDLKGGGSPPGSMSNRSMSAKGRSPDNVACKGFFGRLKNEFFYHRDWRGVSAAEFIRRLDACLRYCCEGRIKESLGWLEYRLELGTAPERGPRNRPSPQRMVRLPFC